MAKLKIRTKRRETLPGGIYEWQIDFNRTRLHMRRCPSNEDAIAPILELLKNTAVGKHRMVWEYNWLKKPVGITLYLTHKSDVAMIKMCYSDAIRKIYQLKLEQPA